jgi:hypothetical protein
MPDSTLDGTSSGMEIVERALAMYAACRTYSDEGEYVLSSPGVAGFGGFRDVRPFRTRFVRPGWVMFMFRANAAPTEKKTPPEAFAMWTGGQPVPTPMRWWWNLSGRISEAEDVRIPIGAATGISGGAAVLVLPTLLDLEDFPGLLEALVDVRAMAPEEAEILGERVMCDVVHARHSAVLEEDLRLSFDRRSGLLVRVEQQSGKDRETTSLRPRVDEDVSDDELVFVPPEGARGTWWGRMVQRLFMS